MRKPKIPGIFSERKKELLILLSKDYSQKMAADEMCISYETVKSHIAEMREDVPLHSTFALFAYAVKTGQIKPEDL